MDYYKQPLSPYEQILLLKKRNLIISDESEALAHLRRIGYFRFASYLRPMEIDHISHVFKPQSTFENGLLLYKFDNKLRVLIFNAIQIIEIALRASIIDNTASVYGPFWFSDVSLMANVKYANENLLRIKTEVLRSKEDFINEYFKKYTSPEFPPVWKTLEVVSFGVLSKLYDNLKDSTVQKRIAKDFGLPQHKFLKSWIASLSVLRNCVAHHARIWNRKFPVKPKMPNALEGAWISPFLESPIKLYPQLCCIRYLLNIIDSTNSFAKNLKNLLAEFPNVDVRAMGFPSDWEKQPLWR